MPYVRQSLAFLTAAGAIAVTGCSSLDLARFAPPGVVKYEDIASEKPPNPTIQAAVDERKATPDKEFPKLAETPSEKDRPQKRRLSEVNEEIGELAGARDNLNAEVAASREQAEAEMAEIMPLPDQRDALDELLQRDEASALAERKDPPPSAGNQ